MFLSAIQLHREPCHLSIKDQWMLVHCKNINCNGSDLGNVINENTSVFINLLYLLHLSLGNWLSLKAGVGSALSGVSSGPLSALVCGVREAVEEGHLLSQA